MNYRKLASAVALAAATATASAQQTASPQQPSPEQIRALMQATMGAMVSVMGPMTEAIVEAQLNVAARPETAERIAAFKKNLFDALVKKGFTTADALQIAIATPAPSASPSAK